MGNYYNGGGDVKGKNDFAVLASQQALHVWRPSHSRLDLHWCVALARLFATLPNEELARGLSRY